MSAFDRSTGPIPREKFAALVDAPFGEAAKQIRKFDPLWGLAQGTKIKWRVECSGKLYGGAIVEASSEEEAMKLADKLTTNDVDWDNGSDDFEILSVEPAA